MKKLISISLMLPMFAMAQEAPQQPSALATFLPILLIFVVVILYYTSKITRRKKEKTNDVLPFCPKCGTEVTENANFCQKCGNTLQNTADWRINKNNKIILFIIIVITIIAIGVYRSESCKDSIGYFFGVRECGFFGR